MRRSEQYLLLFAILFTITFYVIISIFFLLSLISQKIFESILLGNSISILNFIIGFSLLKFSINKTEQVFLLALWGGILIRLILGLALILITLIFLEINTYGFIFSILFFYVFYLLIEIFYLNLGRKSQFGSKQ